MNRRTFDFRSDPLSLARIFTPFFAVNVIASLVWILWPIAIPVLCAEFCLLAIWSAWGPGEFWKRFLTCVLLGALLFLSLIYLWIVTIVSASSIRPVTVLAQWLFSAWILAQIPLWGMRFIWNWRITDRVGEDLQRFSVNDNMIGLTMICAALASCRWATDDLIETYGPFGYETVWVFYAWAMLEFYLLVAIAGFGTWLVMHLESIASTIIPLLVAGFLFAVLTSWGWFPVPDRWLVTAVLWVGSILFSWSIVLVMRFVKKHGYQLMSS